MNATRRRHVKLLRDVAEYLDQEADDLAGSYRNRGTGKVEPASVALEIFKVRRWSQQLRTAALREVAD